MAKLIKWFFILLLALALLLAAAGFVATRSVDTDTVKGLIEEQAQQATSLNMNFKGDLSWSFFPRIRLGVSAIELHTQKMYDGDTLFAEIGEASSAISLLKLLTGNLSVDKLELADIKLRMVTDQRGHSNWKDIEPASKANASDSETKTSSAESDESDETSSTDISFSNVNLQNIQLSLIDLSAQTNQSLLIKAVDGKDINFSGSPFSIKADVAMTSDAVAKPIELLFASSFNFDQEAQEFMISKITGSLDATKFSGSGTIAFGKDTAFKAALALDTLDLNRYLSEASDVESPASDGVPVSEDVALPLDTLHTLNAAFELSISKLIYEKTALENLTVDLDIDDGVLNVRKLDASVYGGSIRQSFIIDANRNPALLTASQTLSAIDLTALFASNDFEIGLEGKASIETQVSARGASANALKETLSGETTAVIASGRYLDDNIEQRICQSIALARQTALSKTWSEGTALSDINLAIQWNNGIGLIQSFNAGLANASVTGDGRINIVASSFDLRLLANISGDINKAAEAPETGCEINEQYRSIAWPLRCEGSAEASTCSVDNSRLDKILSNLAKAKAKEAVNKELDEQKDKLQEKLSEKLGEDVGNALRGLFR